MTNSYKLMSDFFTAEQFRCLNMLGMSFLLGMRTSLVYILAVCKFLLSLLERIFTERIFTYKINYLTQLVNCIGFLFNTVNYVYRNSFVIMIKQRMKFAVSLNICMVSLKNLMYIWHIMMMCPLQPPFKLHIPLAVPITIWNTFVGEHKIYGNIYIYICSFLCCMSSMYLILVWNLRQL